MHITEFVQAVNFHNELNPKLWSNHTLRPEVRSKLLNIAQDFIAFIGLPQLHLKDITVSGSNASYGYGEHSDLDLHLVVTMPNNAVMRELFDAKKNNYNFKHHIQIEGIDVEVYIQDALQPHHSAGIYSVLDDEWLSIPKKERPNVSDREVRTKARNYASMINKALKSNDLNIVHDVMKDLKRLRQSGLDISGEYSVENLAFKLLRSRGQIDKLHKHLQRLKDSRLSLGKQ